MAIRMPARDARGRFKATKRRRRNPGSAGPLLPPVTSQVPDQWRRGVASNPLMKRIGTVANYKTFEPAQRRAKTESAKRGYPIYVTRRGDGDYRVAGDQRGHRIATYTAGSERRTAEASQLLRNPVRRKTRGHLTGGKGGPLSHRYRLYTGVFGSTWGGNADTLSEAKRKAKALNQAVDVVHTGRNRRVGFMSSAGTWRKF